jgi:hypothetical protein
MKTMASEKFNKKYEKYIKDGFKGCELSNKTAVKFLDEEFERLIIFEDFKFTQIIMKNNICCFYCDNIPYGIIERITDTIEDIYLNS